MCRNLRADALDVVFLIDVDQLRLEVGQFDLVVIRVSRDDQNIAHRRFARRRPVDGNHAGAFLAANGIGGETLAIVDVVDFDFFLFTNIRGIQQELIDRAGAFIFKLRGGDADTV